MQVGESKFWNKLKWTTYAYPGISWRCVSARMCWIHVRPVHPAAAPACFRRTGVGRGVKPVGQRHCGEQQPDSDADNSTDDHRPVSSEIVVTGYVSVDGQGHEREDADLPDPIVHWVGQLTYGVSERPVGRVGGPAEQRKSCDEAQVCQSEVSDVEVGYRLGPQLTMTYDDVEDKRVTGDADCKRQQVRHEWRHCARFCRDDVDGHVSWSRYVTRMATREPNAVGWSKTNLVPTDDVVSFDIVIPLSTPRAFQAVDDSTSTMLHVD